MKLVSIFIYALCPGSQCKIHFILSVLVQKSENIILMSICNVLDFLARHHYTSVLYLYGIYFYKWYRKGPILFFFSQYTVSCASIIKNVFYLTELKYQFCHILNSHLHWNLWIYSANNKMFQYLERKFPPPCSVFRNVLVIPVSYSFFHTKFMVSFPIQNNQQ